ncbi:MAG: L-threonylcarbamoyladenylate synthase [Bacteroidota bacterium]|nr:L-threonylcarbamoyladenylate synthase [Bacteroidota bacterium]MDP3143775.1 L-threonylcarbamoyladenylate synthase [Bacteroidota bacterium]
MAEIGKNIDFTADLLFKGKLVAIPTETVYGLAANALNEKAVLSIFVAKDRPFFDPLIIHLPSIESIDKYADLKDVRLQKLAKIFWPGPLTLLLPKKEIIPDVVTSGLEQVAVRVPNHPFTLELLKKINFPLAAPSANPFGYVSPTEPIHVNKQLGDKIEYILDGGICSIGLESTIIGIEDDKVCVFRLGGLALEEIENVVGRVELRINDSSNPKAPGQLKSHYAPKKPLYIGNFDDLIKLNSSKKIAIICFGEENFSNNNYTIFNLSKTKNLQEAALNLFKYIRLADESDADVVLCEKLPNEGLGRAINDRLKRASAV